jgi:hypothetical protein
VSRLQSFELSFASVDVELRIVFKREGMTTRMRLGRGGRGGSGRRKGSADAFVVAQCTRPAGPECALFLSSFFVLLGLLVLNASAAHRLLPLFPLVVLAFSCSLSMPHRCSSAHHRVCLDGPVRKEKKRLVA